MSADEDLAPTPLDAREEGALRRKLLLRVAADSTPRHLTLQPGAEGWQVFMSGVDLKVLNECEDGALSYMLRIQPGAQLPPHRHPVDEECVVLEGEVQIGSLRVAAGGYHLGRRGVLHDAVRSEGGALLFLRGAAPDLETLL